MNKQYIGDGVYVEVENGMLKLTTDDGVYSNNTIYLDSDVLGNLQKYIEELKKQPIGK